MTDETTPSAGQSKPDQSRNATVIKKYANRRLYNTATSTYVTLEDLARMVKEGADFIVYDAKSGEDITRSVLTQIIFEEENKGDNNLLPINFLAEMTSIGTLVAFLVVSIGVMVLRRTAPDLPRGFRVPGYPVTPVLSVTRVLVEPAAASLILKSPPMMAWFCCGNTVVEPDETVFFSSRRAI